MRFYVSKLLTLLCALAVAAKPQLGSIKLPRQNGMESSTLLQDIVGSFRAVSLHLGYMGLQVTWDQYSLKINGKRLMIFSGEVHPFRSVVDEST